MQNTPYSNKEESGSRRSLLDDLAAQLKCEYLSNLKDTVYRESLHQAVAEMDAEEYTVKQWADAVNYITSETTGETESAAIKGYLITWLAKK